MSSVLTYNLDGLDYAKLRTLTWEAMSSKWKRQGHDPVTPSYRADYNDICMSIAELAATKGIIATPAVPAFQPFSREISDKGKQRIGSILWGLVAQEILYIDLPRNTVTGNTYYAFDMTEYGLQSYLLESPFRMILMDICLI